MGDLPPPDARPIRVDSIEEEYAFLAAYPPAVGAWQVTSQRISPDDEPTDQLEARADDGQRAVFTFELASFFGSAPVSRLGRPTTEFFDALAQRAGAFAANNGPQHPGTLPRFPIPSARYAGRVDVPMAVLATDEQGRALFAPPRVVTLAYPTGEPVGVGEFPGFDPERWPPPRLGDWPPPALAGVDRARLGGIVGRFSAVGTRLFESWLNDPARGYPQIGSERREFVALLAMLDGEGMTRYYRVLNPLFWEWLTGPS